MAWILSSLATATAAGTGTMHVMGGTLSGAGMISGTVSVGANGCISPGLTTGTLVVDGVLDVADLADGGSGKLFFDLDARGASNDQIATTGTVVIGMGKLGFNDFTFTNLGGLEVGTYTLIAGLELQAGDSLDAGNLSGTLGDFTCTLVISGGNLNLIVSQDYNQWANVYLPVDVSDLVGNSDGDSLTNLQEYAFGTDPTVMNSPTLSYVPGGAVTPGLPKASNLATGSGVNYRALFCRRKDHVAAGLTYTVQFSSDLSNWVTSAATPTLLSGASSAGAVDVVSVPYPLFIATSRGVEKPGFFRVGVSKSP